MDKEFHYFMTGIIARRAGFGEAEARTIAHASQYVDDNDEVLLVLDADTGEAYGNYISQTMNILKPKQELLRVYPIFHFVPDESQVGSARRDGGSHVLDTKPGNENARRMLAEALGQGAAVDSRLHRIGIASHAFVDTWAHQNFVGWYDAFNGQDFNPLPNIGHADFMHHPDWPGHRWQDTRLLNSDVDNTLRFLSAAHELFAAYAAATGNPDGNEWEELERDLVRAMGPTYSGDENKGKPARQAEYDRLAPWLGGENGYDEHAWLAAATEYKVERRGETRNRPDFHRAYSWLRDLPGGKEGTDWYRFQEGVKAHQAGMIDSVSGLLGGLGPLAAQF